jgi:hypothetical protein
METFLREAAIGPMRVTSQGVTSPHRATLTGEITHDAGIQTVHETKELFKANHRTERNFKDWWDQ